MARRTDFLVLELGFETAEVAVAQGLGSTHSAFWVGHKHVLEQLQSFRVEAGVSLSFEVELHLLVLLVDLLVFGSFEDRLSGEEDMEDDSCRKDVAFRFDVLALVELDDFGRNVAWSSTPEEEVFLEIGEGGKSIIDDDRRHGSGGSKHDVFRLQIAVHDPLAVHLPHPAQQAVHELLDLALSEETIRLLDPVEELSSGQDLQHHVDGVLGLVDSF